MKLLNETANFKWSHIWVSNTSLLIDPNTEAGWNALMQELRDQIRDVHCALIISGLYTQDHYWIEKEIELARQLGKPLIGILPWRGEQPPAAVQDAAKEMVGWNARAIIAAIWRHALKNDHQQSAA